jgi:hypothetical protein
MSYRNCADDQYDARYDAFHREMYEREVNAKKQHAHWRNVRGDDDGNGYHSTNQKKGFWFPMAVPYVFDVQNERHKFSKIKDNGDGTFTAADDAGLHGTINHTTFNWSEVNFRPI